MRVYLRLLLTCITIIILASFGNAQPTNGLVAYFKLNGNTTNSGPAAVTATANSITYTTNNSGAASSALQFAGSTASYLSFTDNGNLDFTGDFSISFAVKPANLAINQGFYDNCLNYGGAGIWWFASDNTLRFNFKNGTIGATAGLTVGQWKSVCAVRSGSTLLLYVNGVQVASGPEGTNAITYPYPPVGGQMYYFPTGGNYNPTTAAIDEMRFYNRALSAIEVAQLSPFVLPLQMGAFTASRQTSGVVLNWETITEENIQGFDVERSSDGNNYSKIGDAQAAGNSTTKKIYSFTDRTPLTGANFYRLKIKDGNGSFSYSKTVVIRNDREQITLQLFPNPVINTLQIQFTAIAKQPAHITISNAGGVKVYDESVAANAGLNALSVNTALLPKGVYFLQLTTGEETFRKKFIKE